MKSQVGKMLVLESGGWEPQGQQLDQEGGLSLRNDIVNRPWPAARRDLHGALRSHYWWRTCIWRRLLWLWAVLVLAGGTLTAPGVWCQSDADGSFTFRPGDDEGFICSCLDETHCPSNTACLVDNSSLQLITSTGSSRFMRAQPVRLWGSSFWTFFVIRVSPIVNRSLVVDGFAFLIAPNTSTPIGSGGGGLGLFETGNNGEDSRIVGIMFDTYRNARDPETPYVGQVNNNVRLPPTLTSQLVDFLGNTFGVWLEYDVGSLQPRVEVSMVRVDNVSQPSFTAADTRDLRPSATTLLSAPLNVTDRVEELSYVGFSAGSGTAVQRNEIFYWHFQMGEGSASSVPAGPAPGPSPATAIPAPSPGVEFEPGPDSFTRDRQRAGMPAVAVVAVSCTAALIVVVASSVLLFCCCRKRLGPWSGPGKRAGGKMSMANLTTLRANTPASRKFSYRELRIATHNFAETSVLGEGGFGKVFKGQLKDGTDVAVKRISERSRQGEKEFLAEVTIIERLRHQSLVPLLGWCLNTSKGELLLVYEYMPNGSLDRHVLRQDLPACSSSSSSTGIASSSRTSSRPPSAAAAPEQQQQSGGMSWDARYHVLQGVASALLYLHEDWQEGGGSLKQAVVHRDIKSSNVMLDADMNGRLGDFGMARVVHKNRPSETVSTIVGTHGYLAPEYARTAKVSVLTDVYSFGVLVLEVVTGRRPLDWTQPDHKQVLIDWIRSLHQAGARLESAADSALREDFNTEQVVLLLQLGLMCTADDPKDRPSMRYVVQSLLINTNLLPLSSAKLSKITTSSIYGPNSSRHTTERSEGSASLPSDSY